MSSTSVTPPAASTAVPVPWNPAAVQSGADPVPAAEPPIAPANLDQCGGPGFRLLPNSPQSTSTSGGYMTTTFVLQFIGSAPCSINPGFFGVDMAAADGTNVPIDAMPAGPAHRPLEVRPQQFVFGSKEWTVKPGLPHPSRLTFVLGDTPSRPLTLSVADVPIPPHSSTPSPENAWHSTAYELLTSSADPASLATLTATATAPSTAQRHTRQTPHHHRRSRSSELPRSAAGDHCQLVGDDADADATRYRRRDSRSGRIDLATTRPRPGGHRSHDIDHRAVKPAAGPSKLS